MTCIVHDKRNTHIPLNQDGGSVQVVARKLDLDQTSVAHTHTERHIGDQTQFSVANFSLDDSDDICDPEWLLKCFSSRVGLTLIIYDAC